MASSILILSNSDSGLYDFRKEVLKALMEKGFHVLVSVPDTGYVERIKALGCEYIPTAFERRGMNPFQDMKLLLFYRRLIKTHSPAAVLTYTIKPNIYGGLAARLTGTPYLVNVTGLGTTLEHGGVLQKMIVLMYRTALKKASCVFFPESGQPGFPGSEGLCHRKDAGDSGLRRKPEGTSAAGIPGGYACAVCFYYAAYEG